MKTKSLFNFINVASAAELQNKFSAKLVTRVQNVKLRRPSKNWYQQKRQRV